jgi:hypothetical protein
MPICASGCGGSPIHGKYLPVHDGKLRKIIEEKVGGLLNLKALVQLSENFANNEIGPEIFRKKAKEIFFSSNNLESWHLGFHKAVLTS